MEDNKFVLEVSDLHTTFKTDNGDVSAVNGVSFRLEPGKTLGIVGESGSDVYNRQVCGHTFICIFCHGNCNHYKKQCNQHDYRGVHVYRYLFTDFQWNQYTY